MLIEVNQANFDEVLKTDKPVMIDFFATWCGPCKMAMPQVEWMANTYEEDYVIGKVNIDENPDLVAKFQIAKIPAFRFFKNGELVDEMPAGDIRRSLMEKKLKALI